jgi:siroheme synthase
VERGTTRRQRVASGTLDTIVERVEERGFKSPCLIVVGEVVSLHEKLQWFDSTALETA